MSFTEEIRDHLCQQYIKNKCCRKALIYGALYSCITEDREIRFSTDNENTAHLIRNLIKNVYSCDIEYDIYDKLTRSGEASAAYKLLPSDELTEAVKDDMLSSGGLNTELFVCENCKSCFVRGLFISDGTINDPENGYHLEFSISDDIKRENVIVFLEEQGFSVRSTVRRGVGSIYVKESETIMDILTYIGASKYSLEIMNLKIKKSIINNENRRRNCDMANLSKSIDASLQLSDAIKRMISDNKLDGLGEQLKCTALLRLENPELSLKELASIHVPAISKSGLSHRFDKIMNYYNSIYNE